MSKIERSPLLSVVVCTFERYSLLKGAICSLQSQTLCKNAFEILIIDNSRDEQWAQTVAKTYAEFANVRYIYTSEPGLARARNLGLVEAHSDIVAFMDDDAVAEPMWAKALLDGFAAFGRTAGALGGPVIPIWPSARPDWLGDDLLIFLGLIDWGIELHRVLPRRGLVGCNMAVDRALALSLGGFPVGLGRSGPGEVLLSNEETALLARIENNGRSIVYAPGAIVRHVIDSARLVPDWFIRRAAWQAVSDYMMRPDTYTADTTSVGRFQAITSAEYVSDAAAFSERFWVTYHAVLTALAGGAMPVGPSASFARQMRSSILKGKIFAKIQTTPLLAGLARAGLTAFKRH